MEVFFDGFLRTVHRISTLPDTISFINALENPEGFQKILVELSEMLCFLVSEVLSRFFCYVLYYLLFYLCPFHIENNSFISLHFVFIRKTKVFL